MSRLPRGPLEATVDGFTHGGEGVARIDGKAVFVPGALPGERIRVQVTTDRKRWARADLLAVLEPASERVAPPCPYADQCGGCDLQHVDVEGQLRLKTRVVREQLERIGRIVDPPVAACAPVGPALGYRTQARMHADPSGRLGFHRRGTNDVVPIDRCIVLTDDAQAVRDAIGDESGASEVAVHATSTGERAALLTLDDGAHRVRGPRVLTERVAGFDFDVTAGGFFQGNIAGAAALVDAVMQAVAPGHQPATLDDHASPGALPLAGVVAWDLYAGVGLFALPLAAAGAEVTAVEVVPDAVEHLRTNRDRAGLGSTRTSTADTGGARVLPVAADVATFVARPGLASPDLVVLDPPRTGCGTHVMAALADAVAATIVYVACDPAALARDARVLVQAGWSLDQVRPFDLFPMTHHVEAVATFRR